MWSTISDWLACFIISTYVQLMYNTRYSIPKPIQCTYTRLFGFRLSDNSFSFWRYDLGIYEKDLLQYEKTWNKNGIPLFSFSMHFQTFYFILVFQLYLRAIRYYLLFVQLSPNYSNLDIYFSIQYAHVDKTRKNRTNVKPHDYVP